MLLVILLKLYITLMLCYRWSLLDSRSFCGIEKRSLCRWESRLLSNRKDIFLYRLERENCPIAKRPVSVAAASRIETWVCARVPRPIRRTRRSPCCRATVWPGSPVVRLRAARSVCRWWFPVWRRWSCWRRYNGIPPRRTTWCLWGVGVDHRPCSVRDSRSSPSSYRGDAPICIERAD